MNKLTYDFTDYESERAAKLEAAKADAVKLITECVDEAWEDFFGHRFSECWPNFNLPDAITALRLVFDMKGSDGYFAKFSDWFMNTIDPEYHVEEGAKYENGDGSWYREIEGVEIEIGPYSGKELCDLIGADNVKAICTYIEFEVVE